MKHTYSTFAAIVVALVCCVQSASGEKVFFRDELIGCEMWRMSNYSTFHEYCHASHPFSYDGRRIACRWYSGKGIVVFDLADGSETVFGKEHAGTKQRPCFVRGRGRCGIVYSTRRAEGGSIFLHWLDTGQERLVMKMPPGVSRPCAGIIGPKSEYVLLRGDLNGDGLGDWSLKSLWTDEPARVVWTSPTAAIYVNTVSPTPACNRLDMTFQICHPTIIARAHSGERLNEYQLYKDASFKAFIAVLDIKTCTVKTYPAAHALRWAHEAWSGDGEYLHMGGYSWRAGVDAPSAPIRIAPYKKDSNHYGTCGHSGRYVAGDSGPDGMERLELTDLWTGEMHTVAHISTPTNPPGKIAQDHGHPAGSPDGTKVLFHSCYDLVNHRLYAIPTQDVRAGDKEIQVETTEGFARQGKLLVRYGYNPYGMVVSYQRIDATHFYGCDWGAGAAARLKKAIRSDAIAKGAHVITDLAGRFFPGGKRRPRKEYIAVVKLPDPPRALAAKRVGNAVRLAWQEPISHEETAGYVVYRRVEDQPLARLTPKPVGACEFVDQSPPQKTRVQYWVRAVENSGLYGAYSGMAWVDAASAGAQVVDSYDVRGCNFVVPGERPTSDRRDVRVHAPVDGVYSLWARCRAWRELEELHVTVDGKPLPDARVEGKDWHWVKVAQCRLAAGQHAIEFARETKYHIAEGNLLENGSFEDGLKGWKFDETVTSIDATRAHSGKQCVKLSGMLTKKKLFQTIALEPKPEWSYRMSFWLRGKFTKSEAKRYHGPHPNTLGRIAVNVKPFPLSRGWTCDGNQFDDKQWHHIEVVVNSPANVSWRQVNAQPFWCPWYWGEQVGNVWIDDVEVVELGPRLRPAKVTKLLVTNLPGYQPKGRDGRGAFRPPRAPLIAVNGLRQTGRTRNTISLAWNPTRPGTRGYNVYARAGSECPTTRYFRATTVWGKTSATVEGLANAGVYAVKVAALNEDGIEGPPACLTARTATAAAETHVMEAEKAALTAPIEVKTGDRVTFVVTPADPKREELYDRKGTGKQTGAAKFEFTIKERGTYVVWGRLFGPDGGSNSLWFSLDGGKEVCWNVPSAALGKWVWLEPSEGERYDLAAGKHVITVRTREAGTRLDRLVVTNDLRPAPPVAP